MKLFAAFGLILGLFLAFAGLMMVNTHFGIEATVVNPLYQTPLLGGLLNLLDPANAEVEVGLSIEGLGQIFLTGLVMIMAFGLFVIALLMFLLRGPEMIRNYAIFSAFLIVGFLLSYFIGLSVLGGVLNV